ncbi:MAG: GPW/gp25 family protein [Rhabdochlamydiaceae bacterium]
MSLLSHFRKGEKKRTEVEEIFESICDLLNTRRTFGSYQKDLGLDAYVYLSSNNELAKQIVQDIKDCIKKYEKRVIVHDVLPMSTDNIFLLSFVIKCKIRETDHSFHLSFHHQKKLFSEGAT